MKLYITGSVASGKTTLAAEISQASGIPCFHLDDVVHERRPEGDRKRTDTERDALFDSILALPSYIIEDTGRPCFERGMSECDILVLLNPPKAVRRVRILRRFVRQKLGIEKASYKPTLSMLRKMFRWADNFDSGRDNLRERLSEYDYTELKNRHDIEIFRQRLTERKNPAVL